MNATLRRIAFALLFMLLACLALVLGGDVHPVLRAAAAAVNLTAGALWAGRANDP